MSPVGCDSVNLEVRTYALRDLNLLREDYSPDMLLRLEKKLRVYTATVHDEIVLTRLK